jgi:hypothetical protein
MKSPFAEGRFEHEERHLYFLPRKTFSDLERPLPTFLIGARGSGKTTLLKALNWEQRVSNPTLCRQLGDDPFRGSFIGTYVKLPKIQLNIFDDWLSQLDEGRHGQILGLYLDLVFLELLANAVAEMVAQGHLKISARVESELVSKWLDDNCDCYGSLSQPAPNTVAVFRGRTAKLRKMLEQAAQTREEATTLLKRIPIGQIGELSRALAPKLAQLCDSGRPAEGASWHFKVCMDEAECLRPFQQKVINTLIRLAEWPLFPVVSYVRRPDDLHSTLIPHLTHQKADRQLIVLDDMQRPDFTELAQGVASVRCQEGLNEATAKFDANITLGALDLNALLQTVIDKSENPEKTRLIEQARQFQHDGDFEKLPIYEAYLAERLGLTEPGDESTAEKRHEASQEYRKKMVAAYLSICHDLKVKHIPYASAEMVFGISDNCVRDFLSQLDHVYRESGKSLKDFLTTSIPFEIQSKAIRAASEEKRDSIPNSGVLAPVETGRVVKGLATVTSLIQSTSTDDSHLRSTERGLFRLTSSGHQSQFLEDIMRLVTDAAEAGFLRVQGDTNQTSQFRVHASLAPAFGFSYRGAYYAVSLAVGDFQKLKTAKSDGELSKTANAIANAISGVEQGSLFSNEGGSDGF